MAKIASEQKNQMVRGTFILPPEKAAAFGAQGETYAGLNILRLKVGEVAGPFVLAKILPKQNLGGGGKRIKKPVDVYVATFNGAEIRMPAAASFVGKAKDAGLAIGDTFLVRRGDNYTSRSFGTRDCASYELNITARAGKKA